MALPAHLFDDDQKLAESDFDHFVIWNGEEYPAMVIHRGESSDYVMAGEKPRRRIIVQLRNTLFLESVPGVGDLITFDDVVYRAKGRKPDPVLYELDCEEKDA